MIERHRQQYLNALGIVSYAPRWELPNAAPSLLRDGEFDDLQNYDDESLAESADAQPYHENEHSAAAAVASVVAATSVQAKTLPSVDNAKPSSSLRQLTTDIADKSQRIESPSAIPSGPVKSLRFTLAVWRISDELIVVDSRQLRLALPTDSLLSNILAALGYTLPRLPKAETLRWPVVENQPSSPDDINEARSMVQAFLAAQAEQRPVSQVLLMGAAAAKFALAAEEWPADDDPRALLGKSLQGSGVLTIVVPSLAAMLQTPSLKALTWQAIQPLRINV